MVGSKQLNVEKNDDNDNDDEKRNHLRQSAVRSQKQY
jgi:hypothetical protein